MVKILNKKRVSAIGTKFVPHYSIVYSRTGRGNSSKSRIQTVSLVMVYWWYILPLGAWRRKTKLKSSIDNTNKMHLTMKFTADWSKTSIDFLDVTVSIAEGVIETDPYVRPTDRHQYLLLSSCHFFIAKRVHHTPRH